MVRHDDVDVPKELHRLLHDRCRCSRKGEVSIYVLEASSKSSERLDHTWHAQRITTPWPFCVMCRPRLDQHLPSRSQEVPGNGKSDSRSPTDAGHDGDSANHRSGHLSNLRIALFDEGIAVFFPSDRRHLASMWLAWPYCFAVITDGSNQQLLDAVNDRTRRIADSLRGLGDQELLSLLSYRDGAVLTIACHLRFGPVHCLE